jgi:hypothetical protein
MAPSEDVERSFDNFGEDVEEEVDEEDAARGKEDAARGKE